MSKRKTTPKWAKTNVPWETKVPVWDRMAKGDTDKQVGEWLDQQKSAKTDGSLHLDRATISSVRKELQNLPEELAKGLPLNIYEYRRTLDKQTAKKIDSIPAPSNLEIEVEKTWVNPVQIDTQTYNTAVFVSVNFRPSRPMQLAKITLECEEGLLDMFAASPSLPNLLERNETHEIEFRLPLGINGLPQKHNNFAAEWYIREQLRIGHNQPRSEGRLRITADAKEWISAPFLIPTTVAEPIKYAPGQPSILARFNNEEAILKLAVQKCILGSPVPPEMISSEHVFGAEYAEYIIVIVEYNSSSTTVPLQVAKRQLCLLDDPGIDPIETGETRILDNEETHTLTFKVKGISLLRTHKGESPSTYWGRLCFVLGGGMPVSSAEFQIPTPGPNLKNKKSHKKKGKNS
jgi:hypothetical protein